MEDKFTKTSELLYSAATALDSQWCESDKAKLVELAKAFGDGIECCNQRTYNLEFVHNKDGEYIRCSKCGTSFGAACGFLIWRRLIKEDNHKLLIENAKLTRELERKAQH